MKLCVLTFGLICLTQMGFTSSIDSRYDVQKIRNETRSINGISDQFVQDIDAILDKFQNNEFIVKSALVLFVSFFTEMSKEAKPSKIDVNIMKKASKRVRSEVLFVDYVKIIQSVLLKQLPPERINGLILTLYVMRPSASEDEIGDALNFFYGIDNEAAPFIEIPDIILNYAKKIFNTLFIFDEGPLAECLDFPVINRNTSRIFDSMIDIRPTVRQDFSDILSKFWCNEESSKFLNTLAVKLMSNLHGATKIDACIIKNSELAIFWEDLNEDLEMSLRLTETTFSARLPEDHYRGLMNLYRACRPKTPDSEIQKALEYLYDDVPTKCFNNNKQEKNEKK